MVQTTETVGARIRRYRTKRRLSQNGLAVRAQLHPATISRLERDEREPDIATLRRIADALNVAMSTLAG